MQSRMQSTRRWGCVPNAGGLPYQGQPCAESVMRKTDSTAESGFRKGRQNMHTGGMQNAGQKDDVPAAVRRRTGVCAWTAQNSGEYGGGRKVRLKVKTENLTCSRSRPLRVTVSNQEGRRFTVRFDIDGEFVRATRIAPKGKTFEFAPEEPGEHTLLIQAADVADGEADVSRKTVEFKALRHLAVGDAVHDRRDIPPGYCGAYTEGRGPVLRTAEPSVITVDGEELPAATMHIVAQSAYWLQPGRHEIMLTAPGAEWLGWFDIGAYRTTPDDVDADGVIRA